MSKSLPKTKWFKNSLTAVLLESVLALLLVGASMITAIIQIAKPNSSGSWDSLGDAVSIMAVAIMMGLAAPIVATSICGHRYINDNSKGKTKACLFWASIATLTTLCAIAMATTNISASNSFSLSDSTEETKLVFMIITLFVFILPLLCFIIGCLLENSRDNAKLKIGIPLGIFAVIIVALLLPTIAQQSHVGTDRITIDEANYHSAREFEAILRERGFVHDLPEGMYDFVRTFGIQYIDQNSEYSQQVNMNDENDANAKHPLFVYEVYPSLIEKGEGAKSYYEVDDDADWWVSWYIYDIGGHIYAAINDESKAGTVSTVNIFKTKNVALVSETETIVTYNWKGNYFVDDGCIVATTSTMNRMSIPDMKDSKTFNSCASVTVVDRLDAVTLDDLARKVVK